jgi:dTDP-4-dehydrorhamnose 3,5-epimerase
MPLSISRGMLTREMPSFATWCVDEFDQVGIVFGPLEKHSALRGRGEVMRCSRGRIFDAVTDLAPSYGRSFTVALADNGAALYVPPGVAHGCQALTDNVCIDYLMSARHDPGPDAFRYDDPAAAITQPLQPGTVFDRDLAWPPLSARAPLPGIGHAGTSSRSTMAAT